MKEKTMEKNKKQQEYKRDVNNFVFGRGIDKVVRFDTKKRKVIYLALHSALSPLKEKTNLEILFLTKETPKNQRSCFPVLPVSLPHLNSPTSYTTKFSKVETPTPYKSKRYTSSIYPLRGWNGFSIFDFNWRTFSSKRCFTSFNSLNPLKSEFFEQERKGPRIVPLIRIKICKTKNLIKPKSSRKLSLSELRKRGKIGFIYLTCTKNNTICTLIDPKGNPKGWNSSGTLGFKNARKSTIYAAQGAAEMIGIKAKSLGFKRACLIIKGLGRGKESSVRTLRKSGLKILSVEEKTPIPHNGCRPPKKRRV